MSLVCVTKMSIHVVKVAEVHNTPGQLGQYGLTITLNDWGSASNRYVSPNW